MPARKADSNGVSTFEQGLASDSPQPVVVGAEVRARGRLDAVGAVAEVDRVQVLGEDLLLGPLARQVVGERGLAQLLEHRPLFSRSSARLTNCWVIVDPPWRGLPWITSATNARPMACMSTPAFV